MQRLHEWFYSTSGCDGLGSVRSRAFELDSMSTYLCQRGQLDSSLPLYAGEARICIMFEGDVGAMGAFVREVVQRFGDVAQVVVCSRFPPLKLLFEHDDVYCFVMNNFAFRDLALFPRAASLG